MVTSDISWQIQNCTGIYLVNVLQIIYIRRYTEMSIMSASGISNKLEYLMEK